ncbi:hypothetical protein JJ728_23120, partial [Salmonella enterica subsp. enterica serovar Typhi]|nr:hypothetical protein [Salmonella enterica subsp. enterica serovar Typhi]
IYNLPPYLCMKRKYILMSLMISGPRQPGNGIDVYLAPLIEDLKKLWDEGEPVFDAYREEMFTLRAMLFCTINDFPAYGNLSGYSVKGHKACPICEQSTDFCQLAHGRKIVYLGHRRFLPETYPYRRMKRAFNGFQEFRKAPEPLSGAEGNARVKDINVEFGKPSESSNNDTCCWKKKSIFELPYWETLDVRHCLDVMHIEKNICESLLGRLLNIPGKTKDGYNVRLDMVDMNIRSNLAPIARGQRTYLPPACHTLSRKEKKQLCSSLRSLKVPSGYSSNVSRLVSLKDLKLVGLKSHDCHALMQQLLPVAIRSILPKHVKSSIIRLCFFFNAICCKVIDRERLDQLQDEI